jgi:hypothetical protein
LLEPLKGFLDAEMNRPGDPLRQYVAMNDPASRPMRPDDEIRVRTEFNRPATSTSCGSTARAR